MNSDLPLGSLLLTVFNSIFEVFLLCLAGYVLAGRGILDKKTQKQLNHLNVSLFTPALLFSKVAFFLSPAKLRELWVVPIFFAFVTFVSMAIAFILGSVAGLRRSQRSFAMAAAMFMNSNSLPIALMQSLVESVPGLEWDEYDNKESMLGRALTYLVVYSTLGMVLRWSYGVQLLAQADEPEVIVADDDVNEETPLLIERDDAEDFNTPNQSTARLPVPRRRTTYYNSFPNSPDQLQAALPQDSRTPSADGSPSHSDSEIEDAPLVDTTLPTHSGRIRADSAHDADRRKRRSLAHRIGRSARRCWIRFSNFMTVPLWASLASLLVACLQPVQHVLENHMLAVKSAISSAGKCSIPLTLIVLGAYFYPQNGEPSLEGEQGLVASKSSDTLVGSVRNLLGLKKRSGATEEDALGIVTEGRTPSIPPGETKTVVIAVASRMILTPLLLMPLMALSAKLDFQQVFEDPVFIIANILLISSPPALTLAQITQAASGDAFERLISRTIFWSYCVVTPPTTIIFVVVALIFAKL